MINQKPPFSLENKAKTLYIDSIMDQNTLKELLDYNKDTGVFTWKTISKYSPKKIGDVAGNKNVDGYIQIKINYKAYYAHRLAWLYETGAMPENYIDHINGVKDDNRICNLREVTKSENSCNRGATKNNKSGFKGVYWDKTNNKWRAHIAHQNKKMHIGLYATPIEASEAYNKAAMQLHGQFAKF